MLYSGAFGDKRGEFTFENMVKYGDEVICDVEYLMGMLKEGKAKGMAGFIFSWDSSTYYASPSCILCGKALKVKWVLCPWSNLSWRVARVQLPFGWKWDRKGVFRKVCKWEDFQLIALLKVADNKVWKDTKILTGMKILILCGQDNAPNVRETVHSARE